MNSEPIPVAASQENLPLLDLFIELKEADLPLGIDDYRSLIHALQLGFGTGDLEDLRKLCYALWTKSKRDQRLLDRHFDRLMLPLPVQNEVRPTPGPEVGSEPVEPQGPPQWQPSAAAPQTATQEPEAPGGAGSTPAPLSDDRGVTDRIIDAAEAPLTAADIPVRRFALTSIYYPVTRRQMKQCWRYLRRMARQGRPTVLNVPETAKKIAREGVFLEPVLEPERANSMELLLLIDQQGSMAPFHYLSRSLAETAREGGRLGRAGVHYFHNVPLQRLYTTPALVQSRTVTSVLSLVHPQRTVALIFSDAGAARGYSMPERLEMTRRFLNALRGAVGQVAWLNPMPESRWGGSTAEGIARLVPMFEFDRRGMDEAIDVLRGRYAAKVAR